MAGRTLQPTALIHEAYLRLMGAVDGEFANRRHFFAAAARVMRCIRIDDARRRGRLKRGGGDSPGSLEDEPPMFDQDPAEVLAVHEALDRLEERHPEQAEVVMLRYFASMTVAETAVAMEVSPRTVNKEWRLARAWLHRELSKGDTGVRLQGGVAFDSDGVPLLCEQCVREGSRGPHCRHSSGTRPRR